MVGQEPCARRGADPRALGGRWSRGVGSLAAPVRALPLAPQRAHRRVLLPAGAGSDCSRPASVIGNRWMGGGRRPALPPVAIRTGAGREGEREREGGGKAGEAGPAGTAACAPAKRGAGMSRGRFGAGRSAGWHRRPKVETRSGAQGRPLGAGEPGSGYWFASGLKSMKAVEDFQKRMYGERPRAIRATL